MSQPAPIDIFYPIVPDSSWVQRIAPLGVKTIQLRLKDATPDEISRQIDESLDACARVNCQLVVNDHWQAALAAGCDYLHLGQEDLLSADLATIRNHGVKFGLSSHSPDELELALAARPDYVALGPIWETKLKIMKWAPQGLDRLGIWKARLGQTPLVAIAGITLERAPLVIAAGADSAAVITDFVTSSDPERRIAAWVEWANRARLSSN
jgi:thiamine-phosphate pyrophosphorylase